MTNLLKATTSPPSTMERSSKAEAQVGSLYLIEGAQAASPVTETATEVMDTAPEMSMEPLNAEWLPKSTTMIIAPPTVGVAWLPSLPNLKRVDTAEYFQAAKGVRATDDVGS